MNSKSNNKKIAVEELDKALDDYMMKDSRTAQARLDAELDEYMGDAEDILKNL